MSPQSQQLLAAEIAQLKDENRHLRDQIHRYGEFMAALLELDQAVSSVRRNDELLRLLKRILTDTLAMVDSRDGTLALLDDETAELVFMIVIGEAAPTLRGFRMPSNEGIMGWVVAHQEPTRIENARSDDRFSLRADQTTGFVTRSILAAPLIGDDRVLGVVEMINKRGDEPFDDLDQALVSIFCRFAGQALSGLDRALPFGE
ncbi:MAG: GAF domain-containing protein [Anaerolineae bacterium]|nr:GAF domain-containing protein [Anaerolineae bacterium]